MRHLICGLALALAACGPVVVATPKAPEAPAEETLKVSTGAPNQAALKAGMLPLYEEEVNASNVAKVIHLNREGAKLYSLVGGDPAINGEYVRLGLYTHPDGWRVFNIGDFNAWELTEQSADRVVLTVSHSAIEQPSGEIVTWVQKIAIALPQEGSEPEGVALTPVD